MALTAVDKNYFLQLLNRSGYVAGFNSTDEFDTFTYNSIGIRLCDKYKLSKGKSLAKFMSEETDYTVLRLLRDLLKNYEVNCANELTPCGDDTYKSLYAKCNDILANVELNVTEITVKKLKEVFSTPYMQQQIDAMLKAQTENPADAIGKAKDLFESCCKEILTECNVAFNEKNEKLTKLAHQVFETIELSKNNVNDNVVDVEEIRKLLGSLSQIVSSIDMLRNSYGTGHGKLPNFQGLSTRHAKLIVGSTITLVTYMWERHLELKNRQNEAK